MFVRWQYWVPTMDIICRLYLCAGCRIQVLICSRCDRGQRYCSKDCSKSARSRSLGAANERYQKSPQGRLKHAERMRRYRRYKNKVTYQGSAPDTPNDLLITNSAQDQKSTVLLSQAITSRVRQCHFCGAVCSEFVRYRFLDHRRVQSFVQLDRRGTQRGHSP